MSVYVMGPPKRAARSYLPRARRVEDWLPPLLPGPVGLVDLPGAHALVLRLYHVFDRGPRIAVEGLVEEPLSVGGRGRRGGAHLGDDGPERAVEVGGGAHPVDEADGARGLGAHVVVEQRELLGPAGTTYDDESDGGIGSRRLRVIGERSGEVGVERVEHRGAVERDPGDALLDRAGDGGVVHRSALTRAGLWKRLTTMYDRGQRV